MEFTVKEQIENIEKSIFMYLNLIKRTIEDIKELLEKRNELMKDIDN
jgi:uncharacterized protein YoxC